MIVYRLSPDLSYLFETDLTTIKSIGNLISKNFEGNKKVTVSQMREAFYRQEHFEFFFYEYKRYALLNRKLDSYKEKMTRLTQRAIKSRELLNEKILATTHKINLVEEAALKRLQSPDYCRRKMVKLVYREMLYLGQKNKELGGNSGNSIATDSMVELRANQNKYNRDLLSKKAIIVKGKAISLLSFADMSRKKASELFAKVKGLEAIAEEQSFGWAFLTMTAPAHLHANPVSKEQKHWSRQRLKAAHEFLTNRWSALGKKLANDNVPMKSGAIFGVRVVEPHKDGTPHWHMVIFYNKSLESYLFDNESGVFQRFFQHAAPALKVVIGKACGEGREDVASASSYAFKYILKSLAVDFLNTDFQISDENLNVTAIESAVNRLEAWKAAVNVRAYQMFGVSSNAGAWNAARKVASKTGKLAMRPKENDGVSYFIEEPYFDAELADANLRQLLSACEHEKRTWEQYEYYLQSLEESGDYNCYTENNVYSDVENSCFGFGEESPLSSLPDHIRMHIELNGSLNDYQAGSKEINTMKFVKAAVTGDYATFIKLFSTNEFELIYENYLNKYSEEKKKVIGVNFGTCVHLFDRYEIVDMPNHNK
ncbi:replication endonuclease [Vibrio alginolyticus]